MTISKPVITFIGTQGHNIWSGRGLAKKAIVAHGSKRIYVPPSPSAHDFAYGRLGNVVFSRKPRCRSTRATGYLRTNAPYCLDSQFRAIDPFAARMQSRFIRMHDVCTGQHVLQILRCVVGFAAVAVINLMARRTQPDKGCGNQSMRVAVVLLCAPVEHNPQIAHAFDVLRYNFTARALPLRRKASNSPKSASFIHAFPSGYRAPDLYFAHNHIPCIECTPCQ